MAYAKGELKGTIGAPPGGSDNVSIQLFSFSSGRSGDEKSTMKPNGVKGWSNNTWRVDGKVVVARLW